MQSSSRFDNFISLVSIFLQEQEEKKAKKELKAAEDNLKALGAEAEKAKEILGIRRQFYSHFVSKLRLEKS